MAEKIFTKDNFDEEVLKSNELVFIDFWAPWCGPCRAMSPVIKELAEEMSDKKVKIGKLNVDENAEISGKCGVMSIPTFILFKDGQIVDKSIGLKNKEVLKEKIEEFLE